MGPTAPLARLSSAVRYRGFLLIPQADLSWIVRSRHHQLGQELGLGLRSQSFHAPASSLEDVKALVDWTMNQAA